MSSGVTAASGTVHSASVVYAALHNLTVNQPNEQVSLPNAVSLLQGSITPVADIFYFYELIAPATANYSTTSQTIPAERVGDLNPQGWFVTSHPGIAARNTTAISSAYHSVGSVAGAVTSLLRPQWMEYAAPYSITEASLKLSNVGIRVQKSATAVMLEECNPENPNYPMRELMGAYRSRAKAQAAAARRGAWYTPCRNLFFENHALNEAHYQVYVAKLTATLNTDPLLQPHMTAATIAGASLHSGGSGTPAIAVKALTAADSNKAAASDHQTASLGSDLAATDFGFAFLSRHALLDKSGRDAFASNEETFSFDSMEVFELPAQALTSASDNWQAVYSSTQIRPNSGISGVVIHAYSSIRDSDQASVGALGTGRFAMHQDGDEATVRRDLLKAMKVDIGSSTLFSYDQTCDSGMLELVRSQALPVKPQLEYAAECAGMGGCFSRVHRFPTANVDSISIYVKVSDYVQDTSNTAEAGTVTVIPMLIEAVEYEITGSTFRRSSMMD